MRSPHHHEARSGLGALVVAFLCAAPPAGAVSGATDVAVRATLDNGLRVIVVPSTLAPVVTTEVSYIVGGDETPPGFPGMAHAQEHMMFRGSASLSAAQLSTIAAAIGGEFNADTQQTVTQYYFSAPADDLDIALHLEAERMRGILDSEELWRQERGAIEQEVAQDLSDPEYLLYTKILAQVFKGTPYAVDPLGTRDSFDKTTAAMLKDFHTRWYGPNNAILVIAGSVDPQDTLARVRDLFGGIAARPLPPRPAVSLPPLSPDSFTLDSDLPYGLAVVAYRLPGYRSPDWAAAKVLCRVLNSRRAALYALVPEGKALEAEFQDQFLPDGGLGFAAVAYPSGASGSALVSEVKRVIAAYRERGVPPELVEAAKRLELTDAALRKASISGLADDWSQAVAVEGHDSPEARTAAIERVAVVDVNRVARAYLVNDTAVTGLLTPRASGKPVTSRKPSGPESFTPKQVTPVTLPSWAARLVKTPEPPASLLAPVDTTLPNGLRLIVQPEPSIGAVAVYGQVKNDPDVQTPPGQEGVSDLLAELFSYGTTTLGRLAYQKALDDIGANATLGMEFSLEVLPSAFDRGVELLADGLLHPALPEQAFTIVRQQTVAALPGILESPAYLAERARDRALFPQGDPRLREPTPAGVARLALADVQKYHQQTVRPDLTTIVVLGQVTPEQAKAVVARHFGAWQAVGPKPRTDPPAVPPNAPSETVVPDASRVQDEVTLAQTLGITRFDRDYYTLELGNRVLAGAFYATRLFRDLREETGLVYSVTSEIRAGKTRSEYRLVYASDPGNVARARALAVRDLAELQRTPITAEELQRTRALLLRQIPLAESSFDQIAEGFLGRSQMGLPLDEPLRAARRYLEISAPDVQTAFAKWLRPEGLVQVTLGPPPR